MLTQIALLGSGSIARSHVLAIQTLRQEGAHQELRLHTVLGRRLESASEFAREHGLLRATTELDEVLAEPAIDVVIVTTPTALHAEQTERALRAGKHVLCEIPLATSLADVDRLIQVADAVDRRLMVCHTERYYPPLVEARRMIACGELHPHAIVSRYMFQRRENVNWVGRRRSWTDSLLWHHGCHAVDSALWLLGATEAEVVAQVALPGGSLEIPMDLVLALRTPRDQVVSIAMSYNTQMPFHDYLVIGEETTVQYLDGRLVSKGGVLVEQAEGPEVDSAVVTQDAEYFDALRQGREPAVSARSVRPAMAVLQTAQETLDARRSALGPDARHPRSP